MFRATPATAPCRFSVPPLAVIVPVPSPVILALTEPAPLRFAPALSVRPEESLNMAPLPRSVILPLVMLSAVVSVRLPVVAPISSVWSVVLIAMVVAVAVSGDFENGLAGVADPQGQAAHVADQVKGLAAAAAGYNLAVAVDGGCGDRAVAVQHADTSAGVVNRESAGGYAAASNGDSGAAEAPEGLTSMKPAPLLFTLRLLSPILRVTFPFGNGNDRGNGIDRQRIEIRYTCAEIYRVGCGFHRGKRCRPH